MNTLGLVCIAAIAAIIIGGFWSARKQERRAEEWQDKVKQLCGFSEGLSDDVAAEMDMSPASQRKAEELIRQCGWRPLAEYARLPAELLGMNEFWVGKFLAILLQKDYGWAIHQQIRRSVQKTDHLACASVMISRFSDEARNRYFQSPEEET